MATYEHSTPVYVAPQRLYEYLADVDHLPEYIPRIKEAHTVDDSDTVDVAAELAPFERSDELTVHSEAWLEVREEGRRLEWGAPGNEYHGELEVEETSSGESRLTARLHTDLDDSDAVEAGLVEAVQRIRTLAEDYGVANP
ncbi:MAG: SRPBCC family protein [Actinomycetota bacterium]|nr:SRPBCC family protein [Actinomycetota bacterium]